MKLIGLVAILGLAVGAGVLLASASVLRRRAALRGRESLSMDELFSRYFADRGLPKQALAGYWHECAGRLRLPAELLRPSDSFDQELKSLSWLDPFDDRKDDLAQCALREAKKRQRILDLDGVRTLGELITALVLLDETAPGRSPV